jgi:hypothetical protein
MVAEPIVVKFVVMMCPSTCNVIWLGTGITCDGDSPVNGKYGIPSLAS